VSSSARSERTPKQGPRRTCSAFASIVTQRTRPKVRPKRVLAERLNVSLLQKASFTQCRTGFLSERLVKLGRVDVDQPDFVCPAEA